MTPTTSKGSTLRANQPESGTFLELAVGPFTLALRAMHVLNVAQDVPVAASDELAQAAITLVDLGKFFGGARRPTLPYVVTIESTESVLAIGVDRVGHVRRDTTPALAPIPALGLRHPELFEGGLRASGRLLLVMSPSALVALVLASDLTLP